MTRTLWGKEPSAMPLQSTCILPIAPAPHMVVRLHPLSRLVRQSLALSILVCANAAYAIQPLSDSELDARYLQAAVDRPLLLDEEQKNKISPLEQIRIVLASAAPAPDLSTTQSLMEWQNRQILIGNGVIANSQELFSTLSVNEIGSERYSLRWSGNLDQVADVTNVEGVTFFGGDVELRNLSIGTVTVEVVTF
jgi:hypothetical protein